MKISLILTGSSLSILYLARQSTYSSLVNGSEIDEQHQSPGEIKSWSHIQLARGIMNTADQSVKYLKHNEEYKARRAWDRVLTYYRELQKRTAYSHEKVLDLKKFFIQKIDFAFVYLIDKRIGRFNLSIQRSS